MKESLLLTEESYKDWLNETIFQSNWVKLTHWMEDLFQTNSELYIQTLIINIRVNDKTKAYFKLIYLYW